MLLALGTLDLLAEAPVVYAVLYDSVDGVVDSIWLREVSDNIATFGTDGYIEIDGVRVVDGVDMTGHDGETGYVPAMVLLEDTSDGYPGARSGIFEVDIIATPTDIVVYGDGEGQSGDGGAGRDKDYYDEMDLPPAP